MTNSNDLPRREGKAERREAQRSAAKAEQVKIDSFSVPDRFAERRGDMGDAGYTHQRGE
jgi:hypothetical protein